MHRSESSIRSVYFGGRSPHRQIQIMINHMPPDAIGPCNSFSSPRPTAAAKRSNFGAKNFPLRRRRGKKGYVPSSPR